MYLPGTYQNGFAPEHGMPRYPSLWRGNIAALNPGLGPTGKTLRGWSLFRSLGTLTNFAMSGTASNWIIGQYGYAIAMDGTDDYIDCGSSPGLDIGTNPCTVSIWVKPNSTGTRRTIVNKFQYDGTGDIEQGFYIDIQGSGLIRTAVESDKVVTSNYRIADGTVTITDGQWHHIAIVWSGGSTLSLYQDGKFVASNTLVLGTVTSLTTADPLEIGKPAGSFASYYSGAFSDLMIHTRALAANEIALLARRPGIAYEMAPRRRTRSDAGFRAWWARKSQMIGAGV